MLTEQILMWVKEEYLSNGRGRLFKTIDRALKKQSGNTATWKGALIFVSLDRASNQLEVWGGGEDLGSEKIDYKDFKELLSNIRR